MDTTSYAVLWSPHQGAFHVETVEAMLETNRKILKHGDKGDYIVLDFALTKEEATQKCRHYRSVRDVGIEPDDDCVF